MASPPPPRPETFETFETPIKQPPATPANRGGDDEARAETRGRRFGPGPRGETVPTETQAHVAARSRLTGGPLEENRSRASLPRVDGARPAVGSTSPNDPLRAHVAAAAAAVSSRAAARVARPTSISPPAPVAGAASRPRADSRAAAESPPASVEPGPPLALPDRLARLFPADQIADLTAAQRDTLARLASTREVVSQTRALGTSLARVQLGVRRRARAVRQLRHDLDRMWARVGQLKADVARKHPVPWQAVATRREQRAAAAEAAETGDADDASIPTRRSATAPASAAAGAGRPPPVRRVMSGPSRAERVADDVRAAIEGAPAARPRPTKSVSFHATVKP
ncbi:hypothetical protein CXG81DRAFT_28244 [Caulochytrium protostelioides]|uniref:KxDL domain-containing protein n=1 Tax=Caulochytrium protostelioides TaxID=1555241 RepID=A0A4P9WZR8_9FUNG|nr:hypothetical protein CXG81DRAFT_28244 [Caulochytrium protostelioides]|eukprot:RKO98971.1 hypothetical protein CXG81DRAFT_28244 [Caulochytrium protostelioides]